MYIYEWKSTQRSHEFNPLHKSSKGRSMSNFIHNVKIFGAELPRRITKKKMYIGKGERTGYF